MTEIFGRFDVDVQISDQTVLDLIDPTMDMGEFSLGPSFLNDAGLAHIGNLLDNVEFDQSSPLLVIVFDFVELGGVESIDIFDVTEPVVDHPVSLTGESGFHASTLVVSAYDNVFNLQDVDGVFHDTQAVHVGVNDDVGNVSVNEDLSGQGACNLVGRDSAVGAAYPKNLGRLSFREIFKKVGIVHRGKLHELLVSFKEPFIG